MNDATCKLWHFIGNRTGNLTNSTEGTIGGKEFLISSIAHNFLVTCYVVIFIIGCVGNASVMYILGTKKNLKSFEIQIVSLALADILSAVFSALVSIYDFLVQHSEWELGGTFGCKLFISMDHMTILVSAFTLIMMSVDRLRAIGSTTTIGESPKNTVAGIFIIWLLAFLVVSPYIATLHVFNGACQGGWSPLEKFVYYAVYTNLSCFIPVSIMILVYGKSIQVLLRTEVPGDNNKIREKRRSQYKRIVKMFGTIVVLFFLLTIPNMVMNFIASYYGTFDKDTYYEYEELLITLSYIFYTLSHFNCCVNPFIYAKMHTSIRNSFKRFNTYLTTNLEHLSGRSRFINTYFS